MLIEISACKVQKKMSWLLPTRAYNFRNVMLQVKRPRSSFMNRGFHAQPVGLGSNLKQDAQKNNSLNKKIIQVQL